MFVILLLIAGVILIRQPKVQTWAVNKVLHRIESSTGTEASLDKIHIEFPRSIALNGFYLEDLGGDTLLYAGKLTSKISLFQPFKRNLNIDKISLDDARFFMNRNGEAAPYNFEFLVEELTGKEKITVEGEKVKKPYNIKVNSIEMTNLFFQLEDEGYMSVAPSRIRKLAIDVKDLDLEAKSLHIGRILVDRPSAGLAISGAREKNKKVLTELLPDLGWKIRVDALELNEGAIGMQNKMANSGSGLPVDLSDFALSGINLQVKDIVLDSALSLNILNLKASDNKDITLHELSGKVDVSNNTINAEQLLIELNKSKAEITGKLTIEDFENILNASRMNSRITVYIEASDANMFLPLDKSVKKPLQLDLSSSGSLNNLYIKNLNTNINGVQLAATGNVRNISDSKNMEFDLKLNRLLGSADRLEAVAPWIRLPAEVHSLGDAAVTGQINGKINDVTAILDILTDAGEITTDINLQRGSGPMAYNGRLTIGGVDVAQILPDAPLGHVDGKLLLNGSGTSLDDLNANIEGSFETLEFNGYTYNNIDLTGKFTEKIFAGSIDIADECMLVDFDGVIDLSDSIPSVDCSVNIVDADLEALELLNEKLIVSVAGDITLTGTNLNDLNGSLHLNTLNLESDNGMVAFDTTLLTFKSEPGLKQYDLVNSDLVASIRGNFDPIVLPREIQRSLSEHVYYINFTDTIPVQEQNIQGTISLAEDFGLTKFFLGNIDIPDNLEASFQYDNQKDILKVNAHSNYLGYNKMGVDTLDFRLRTKDNSLMLDANISALNVNDSKLTINDIILSTVSTKDYITWNLEVEDESSPNRIALAPEFKFIGDSVMVHFTDSYLKLNDVEWPFNPDNQLILKDNAFIASNFSIHNEDQYLEIINASSDLTDASLEFHRLDLPALANFAKLDTIIRKGYLSGIIRVQDPLKSLSADIGLIFDSLQVFDYYCNNMEIDAFYDKDVNAVELAAVFDDPNYDLTAIGSIGFDPELKDAIDLDIDVRRLSLSFLDKVLKKGVSFDAHGHGDMQFQGNFKEPVLLGTASLLDTSNIHIDFLGIDLILVEEEVQFTENTMNFQSVNVYDPFGNQAFLEGKLTHYNFKDMSVSATMAFDNYNMMNTTENDNEQFYGRAFGDGSVAFSGLTRNINMDIEMKTRPGTRIFIPVAQAGDVKQYENIIFINPNDTVAQQDVNELLKIKGVNLDFQLEVTPDAELTIVLNTDSDNNLVAHGQGDLDLRIDQNKQLSIYGKYDIRDGKYVFSPQNLISKRFDIQNGSYINWTGKPFEAELNIIAAYNVNARVDNILEDSTAALQTVPMDVIINVGGTLDATDVSFDIQTQQTGLTRVPDEVTIFLNDIKDNEGEVTTQAIALLIVNRFLPSNTTVFASTSLSAGDFGKTTAFELISNQVSNYLTDAISQLITEAELNFNFTQHENANLEEPGQTTEFQVDFKTSFVQNRIIVKVGGNFEVTDAQSTRDNNIAGDFEVEGLLTKDGRLRGEAYHRTADYDIFNEDRSKTGVGLSYQKDFDRISEVFKPDPLKKQRRQDKRRDRKDKKQDKQLQKEKQEE